MCVCVCVCVLLYFFRCSMLHLTFSQHTCRLFGFHEDELVGSNINVVIPANPNCEYERFDESKYSVERLSEGMIAEFRS